MSATETEQPALSAVAADGSRYQAKRLLTWLLMLGTWPLSLPSWIGYRLFGNEEMFDFSAKLLSLVPGKLGQYIRLSFYIVTLRECHYDLAVGFGSFFSHPQASVGRRVVIGAYSIIGTVDLEADVLIASRVSILSGKYQHGGGLRQDVAKARDASGPHYDRIRVGRGCWIGEGAVVMASVGAQSIVSAGAVLAKPAPEEVVAVGNPARFIKIGDFNNG
jgi:acetyltransferase-like isoleucine patch superfamily enzyme